MSKIRRLYIVLSATFVIVVVTVFAVEALAFTFLLSEKATLSEKIYYNEKLTEKENILANLETRYNEAVAAEEIIYETLPEDKEASKLLSDLSFIAKESGLKFSGLEIEANTQNRTARAPSDPSLLQTTKGQLAYELPLEVSVEGPFSNFLTFINKTENYQRLLNIESLEIDRDTAAGADNVQATINLIAYLKK